MTMTTTIHSSSRHGGSGQSRSSSGLTRKSYFRREDDDVDESFFRRLFNQTRRRRTIQKLLLNSTALLCVAATLCLGNNNIITACTTTTTTTRHRTNTSWGNIIIWGAEALCDARRIDWMKKMMKEKKKNSCVVLVNSSSEDGNHHHHHHHHVVPKELLQSFGAYPNIFNITTRMRSEFHPVVKFPLRKAAAAVAAADKLDDGIDDVDVGKKSVAHSSSSASKRPRCFWPWNEDYKKSIRQSSNDELIHHNNCVVSGRKMDEIYDYIVKDFTAHTDNHDKSVLLEGGRRVPQLLSSHEEALKYAKIPKLSNQFDVGRYDEDRRGMYTSPLFVVADDGTTESERRTVHVGIDIGAPAGTPVYAFADGRVHSAGYNPDVGDYGHVIVIEHTILNSRTNKRVVYALYGHLSAKSIMGKHPGQKIRRGQVIGSIGNCAENGGWTGTHLHFQLAVHPPKTHDMPGVVTLTSRDEALLEYVDPRYVLGELY